MLYQTIPYTLLSIHRYAQLLGINPIQFARGATPGIDPQIRLPGKACSDIWFKYDWQASDKVGYIELAGTIQSAERSLTHVLGYSPAPNWIREEQHPYTKFYNREYYDVGYNLRWQLKAVAPKRGRLINPGRRAVSLVGTATTGGGTLVYSDDDGDGFSETATITLATALTDEQEIKVYFNGYDGRREFEVRPVRTKTIAGGNVVIVLDSWLLIDPALYEDFPTDDGIGAIDISTTGNFVTSIDVYREYNDTTQASVQFSWETDGGVCAVCNGTGCDACQNLTQNGCMSIRDPIAGLFVPYPATYDDDEARWTVQAWTGDRAPDFMSIWYYSGEISEEYKEGYEYDPLSNYWAQVIAWLATARLDRPLCGCSYLEGLVQKMQDDLSLVTPTSSHFASDDVLNNPFGTKRGEVMAWKRVKDLADHRMYATVI